MSAAGDAPFSQRLLAVQIRTKCQQAVDKRENGLVALLCLSRGRPPG